MLADELLVHQTTLGPNQSFQAPQHAKTQVRKGSLGSGVHGSFLRRLHTTTWVRRVRHDIGYIRHYYCLYHHSMRIKCGIYVIPYCSYYAIFTSSHQPSWLCKCTSRNHMDLWSHTMYIVNIYIYSII
jgi:hypothetical protein